MLNIMFIFVELKLLFNVPIDMHEGTNKISRKKNVGVVGMGSHTSIIHITETMT